MKGLDDIVCNCAGLLAGVPAAMAMDTLVRSSQNNSPVSRIALDVLAAIAAYGIASIGAYIARDKIFYERIVSDENTQDGSRFCIVRDRRNGKEIGRYPIKEQGYGI